MLIFRYWHDAESLRQLFADERAQHTVHCERGRQINMFDLRVRQGTADQLHVGGARKLQVIRKTRLSGYLCSAVDTSKWRANDL